MSKSKATKPLAQKISSSFSEKIRRPRQAPRSRAKTETEPAPPRDFLRLVTFNIEHGTPQAGWSDPDVGSLKLPWNDKELGVYWLTRGLAQLLGPRSLSARAAVAKKALEDTARIIRKLNPDVVCLQEVDKGQRRSGYIPQAEFLSEALGMPYWRMAAAWAGPAYTVHRRPLHAHITRENGYGLAMMSRWPVKSWHFKRLGKARPRLRWGRGTWTGFSKGLLAGLRSLPQAIAGVKLVFGQMRVLQAARVLTPFGTVAIGNIHLETHRGVAQSQLRRSWRSVFDLNHDNCVLVGDFNLREDTSTEALQLLDEAMLPEIHGLVASYPSEKAWIPLDQLLARGWTFAAEPRTIRMPISDHLAVVYDLKQISYRKSNG